MVASSIQKLSVEKRVAPMKFKGKLSALSVFVGRQDILTMIPSAAESRSLVWQEAANTVLYLEELHRTLEAEGEYSIFVSSHCLMNGLVDTRDVLLGLVSVQRKESQVQWSLPVYSLELAPGEQAFTMEFHFDEQQYAKALSDLPASSQMR